MVVNITPTSLLFCYVSCLYKNIYFIFSIVKQEKEEFVIPMTFSRNNIRMQLKQKYQQVEAVDALTAEAIKALASGDSVEIAPSHIDETDVIVGLPSKNTPDYVDDAADADYDQIPIEKFGLALLKGMGLKDEEIKGPSSEYVCFYFLFYSLL